MLVPRDEICYASRQVMICPGFSLRPGSKLRELSVAARQGQFAIGDEREREFDRKPGNMRDLIRRLLLRARLVSVRKIAYLTQLASLF